MSDIYYGVKHSGKIWPQLYTTEDDAQEEVHACKMFGQNDAEYFPVKIIPVNKPISMPVRSKEWWLQKALEEPDDCDIAAYSAEFPPPKHERMKMKQSIKQFIIDAKDQSKYVEYIDGSFEKISDEEFYKLSLLTDLAEQSKTVPDGWQPIETAPEYTKYDDRIQVWFVHKDKQYNITRHVPYCAFKSPNIKSCCGNNDVQWVDMYENFDKPIGKEWIATHWRPLPATPTPEQNG